jgi:hypothetical protein
MQFKVLKYSSQYSFGFEYLKPIIHHPLKLKKNVFLYIEKSNL